MKNFLPREVARILGVCHQRIAAKLKQGHFPNSYMCECGRSTLIPLEDINKNLKKRRNYVKKNSNSK